MKQPELPSNKKGGVGGCVCEGQLLLALFQLQKGRDTECTHTSRALKQTAEKSCCKNPREKNIYFSFGIGLRNDTHPKAALSKKKKKGKALTGSH